jgi:hypothetical protein
MLGTDGGCIMPISYYIKTKHKLIVLVYTGKIPDDDFLSFYKDLYESGAIDLSFNLLVDLREADSTPRNPIVLRMFANFIKTRIQSLSTRPKVDVVAPKDLSFGLARMYEPFANAVPWDFTVFRTIDAALAWLGLPENLMNNHVKGAQQNN